MFENLCSRRHLLHSSAFGLSWLGAAWLMQQDGLLADDAAALAKPELEPTVHDLLPKATARPPRATAMISMFMIGGPSQIDLFDPKPELAKRTGETFTGNLKFDNAAQASREILGPAWRFRPQGQCGMEISELLPHLATVADEITLIRSMHTAVNNHLPGIYALNTGAGVGGRATLGSWLLKSLGSESQELPAFVALTDPRGLPLIGGENWTSGPLPSMYQGTVVRPKEPRILNLDPPAVLKGAPQQAQLDFLHQFNRQHLRRHPLAGELESRIASYELAARMQRAANEAFDLSAETQATLRMYGVDREPTRDYGTRCLIARRLVERGVRFVQIFNQGQSWDHHSSILTELPKRCEEIDQPAAALVADLKQRGMLDSTLVHWGGEMGRLPVIQIPVSADGRQRVGRDHNTYGFSMWTAGGGLKRGCVLGKTDEFAHYAVEDVVTHHDWLATVLQLFGLDHREVTFRAGPRRISLVENPDAQVVTKIIA